MSSLITETIREILMEEQQVCLPGIGTLRLSPQAAVVSPIEGKVTPPSHRANFNSNLILDDGRILRSLKEIPILTDQEAELLLQEYLKDISDNLDAGRSFTLNGIGRLFKHFDGEVRFTAGGENFSKDSFGLPDVEIKPIVRSERQRRTAADPMLAGAAAGPVPPPEVNPRVRREQQNAKPQSIWHQITNHPDLRQILWYVAAIMAAAAILILGYLVIKTFAGDYDGTPAARTAPAPIVVEKPAARTPPPAVDADRIIPEEPPRLRDGNSGSNTDNSSGNNTSTTGNADQSTATDEQNAPVVANPPINSGSPYNTAFIATGLYGSSANVTKNKARINKAGFEAFDRQEGRYTRVGVRVQYTDRNDLMETLRAIQKDYDDAFVMEVNGEKVRIE